MFKLGANFDPKDSLIDSFSMFSPFSVPVLATSLTPN